MLYLLPTWRHDVKPPPWYGFLDAPGRGNSAPFVLGVPWAMDNGAFTGAFTPQRFIRNLEFRRQHADSCLFVAAPDVVGDSRVTRQQWGYWKGVIESFGFVPAFVLQDGCVNPPGDAEALFLGGNTEYKLGAGMSIIHAESGHRYCHVGRVNTLRRLRVCIDAGAHSVDGTHPRFAGKQNSIRYFNKILEPHWRFYGSRCPVPR